MLEPCKPPWRLNSSTQGSIFQVANGRYLDMCLPFKAGWTLWHTLLLNHLRAAPELRMQSPFAHSPMVPRYAARKVRATCNLTRIIIVRNPHERMLSYYLDKVKWSCNSGGGMKCSKAVYWPRGLPRNASFADAIAAINTSKPRSYLGWLHYAPISQAYEPRNHSCSGDTLRCEIGEG